MDNILVSIIVPSYNAEKTIEKCLKSLVGQTYKNIEILVVNDGSKDKTVDKVQNIKDKRIQIITKENGGLISARKKGLSVAKGEYVFFVDSDDYIEKETIEVLLDNSEGKDIVAGDFYMENECGDEWPRQQKKSEYIQYNIGKREEVIANYLFKNISPSVSGRLMRRTLFEGVEIPENFTIGEDIVINILISLKRTPTIKIVNKAFYHYVQYKESMIHTSGREKLLKRIEFVSFIAKKLNEAKLTDCNIIRESLDAITLEEYYAFLRDGGLPAMCKDFSTDLYKKFSAKDIQKFLRKHQALMVILFRRCTLLGKIFRRLLNQLRK